MSHPIFLELMLLPSWIDPLFCWSKHSPLASWEADFENYIFDSLHVRNLFSYLHLWLNCARTCTLNLEIIFIQILKIIIPLSPNHQCLYCEAPYLSDSWHHFAWHPWPLFLLTLWKHVRSFHLSTFEISWWFIWCRLVFIHSSGCRIGSFSLETYVLQFWEDLLFV